MTRAQDPVEGVPTDPSFTRGYSQPYGGPEHRYEMTHDPNSRRGPAGHYNHLPVSIAEEAENGGWLPGANPTGPMPRNLMTIGSRGAGGANPSFGDGTGEASKDKKLD